MNRLSLNPEKRIHLLLQLISGNHNAMNEFTARDKIILTLHVL